MGRHPRLQVANSRALQVSVGLYQGSTGFSARFLTREFHICFETISGHSPSDMLAGWRQFLLD